MNTPIFHQIEGYIQTLHLVEYPDRLLLLDGGCRCDAPEVFRFIQDKLNRPISDLKLVVITHAHPDHIGGREIYQDHGISVASTKENLDFYKGFDGFLTYCIDCILTYFVAYKRKKGWKNIFFSRKIHFDHSLNIGDDLPFFSDWTILSSPGHTLSDISVYHSDSSTIYVADCLISSRQGFFHPYPILDPQQYKETLRTLASMNIKRFLLAHQGEHSISTEMIQEVIDGTPDTPRNHINSIRKRLLRYRPFS